MTHTRQGVCTLFLTVVFPIRWVVPYTPQDGVGRFKSAAALYSYHQQLFPISCKLHHLEPYDAYIQLLIAFRSRSLFGPGALRCSRTSFTITLDA
ncbi:hypothetical protein OF83DRAFT_502312 [Amylostereum chailletii]|nr:hypothetical protein OF83DRAFT_502312 [Amylostereum chailletii]